LSRHLPVETPQCDVSTFPAKNAEIFALYSDIVHLCGQDLIQPEIFVVRMITRENKGVYVRPSNQGSPKKLKL